MERDESESQFGSKNREKAEETIKLLAEHDMQYQKLTVRGLLGRAKRVLQMTKADDKINNIKEAISVFEKWIEKNGGSSSKSSKPSGEDKIETVPGLGFKDKEAAKNTLKIMEGRDPNYQKLAVKGLLGNAKRVLQGTKNEDKIKSINEGVRILEKFLEEFDLENRAASNMAYLPLDTVLAFDTPSSKLAAEFVEVYGGKAKGRFEHLRTLYPKDDNSKSWDIVRNQNLDKIKEKVKKNKSDLFNGDGSPTEEHLKMIQWAYSPNADKLKTYLDKLHGNSSSQKRKSGEIGEASSGKKKRSN